MAGKTRPETFLRFCMALVVIGTAASMLLPRAGSSEPEDQVRPAMAFLKAETAKLGSPEIKGEEAVAGKDAPALFFATATLFVNSGDEFIRVATNVKKADGSRAIGTSLDPRGKAIAAIKANEAYYGEADILGKAYVTAYEPLRDPAGKVIGIYYVGYPKSD
jgi:hypothetical protein